MGGTFRGNVYVCYACRFRLCFNDLSDVGTVWYFVFFILLHNLDLRLNVDVFLSSITNKTITGLGKTNNTTGIIGEIGTVYRQEIPGSSCFWEGSVLIFFFSFLEFSELYFLSSFCVLWPSGFSNVYLWWFFFC